MPFKNLNVVYTEELNKEEGYWSETSSSSEDDSGEPKDTFSKTKDKKIREVASDEVGPRKGETYGQYTKRKAQEEWEWATKPQSDVSPVTKKPAMSIALPEMKVTQKPEPARKLVQKPEVKSLVPNDGEQPPVHTGEFRRLLELLGSESKTSDSTNATAEEVHPETEPVGPSSSSAPSIPAPPHQPPTANDVKLMREIDSRRFNEQVASEERFTKAVDALELLVISQSFVQSVYTFLQTHHEAFLSTKLQREVGEYSHADFEIYNKYVEKFQGVVMNTLARSCESFDEEEFFEKLFEPRVSVPGSENVRSDPLSFEGWEVLLSLLNFESFVDLMDDFIAARYGADELRDARSTKTASKRGLPQKQHPEGVLEVKGESLPLSSGPAINLRAKPVAKKAPSSAGSSVKPTKKF